MPLSTANPRPCPIALLRARDLARPERWLERGEIVRVVRGVYAPAIGWRELAPWERYVARVHASALRHPDAVFCQEAAAAAWGLPIFGEPPLVHVIGDASSTSRVIDGVRTHTAPPGRPVLDLGGILVSSRADTAVDIARSRHAAVALAVADAALRAEPDLTREMLVGNNETRSSSRGRRSARWALARATPVPESPLESVSRAAIEWLGFPEPELQVAFRRNDVLSEQRVDHWWPQARIAGEADGDLKYDGRFGDAAALLRDRRLRDARLLEHGVRATAHWGWSDVVAAAPLHAALIAAGLQPHAVPEPGPLHTLRRALASAAPSPEVAAY